MGRVGDTTEAGRFVQATPADGPGVCFGQESGAGFVSKIKEKENLKKNNNKQIQDSVTSSGPIHIMDVTLRMAFMNLLDLDQCNVQLKTPFYVCNFFFAIKLLQLGLELFL
jgi:hypothetical protein